MSLIEEIAKVTKLPLKRIEQYAMTCHRRYKVYRIPKRNGKGYRIIAQPAPPVKALQRTIVEILKPYMPMHISATAYRDGVSIVDNASYHKNNSYILKMDFKNFFPSVDVGVVLAQIKENCPLFEEPDMFYLLSILFRSIREEYRYELSIGAPSSPFISNTYMYKFDEMISGRASERGVVYTRYADDLTFSTNEKGLLFDFPNIVLEVLEKGGYETIKINAEKTVFSSKKHNRHVTGLVLTNERKVSIGRDRKREIRTLIFKHLRGELSKSESRSLKGLVSFARQVEPDFWLRLQKKYGLKDDFFKP